MYIQLSFLAAPAKTRLAHSLTPQMRQLHFETTEIFKGKTMYLSQQMVFSSLNYQLMDLFLIFFSSIFTEVFF